MLFHGNNYRERASVLRYTYTASLVMSLNHPCNNSENISFLFAPSHSVAKKLFLDTKNTGTAFTPLHPEVKPMHLRMDWIRSGY